MQVSEGNIVELPCHHIIGRAAAANGCCDIRPDPSCLLTSKFLEN